MGGAGIIFQIFFKKPLVKTGGFFLNGSKGSISLKVQKVQYVGLT
jgi:hypothetical protein